MAGLLGLALCAEEGRVYLGAVSTDGTRVPAIASLAANPTPEKELERAAVALGRAQARTFTMICDGSDPAREPGVQAGSSRRR